jgi:transcriptional regulator with GAF, ATPase, and Fis domain
MSVYVEIAMRPEVIQSVALAVAEAGSVGSVLGGIVHGLGVEGDIALARIWLIEPGDICSSCPMRTECPDQSRCLHLVASAGRPPHTHEEWSHRTGAFRRIPLNVHSVGLVGGSGKPILIGSNLAASQRAADPAWLRHEGIVSFAGQPLIFRGEVLGVLAVFSRVAMDESQAGWLRTFADHAAVAIANARAFDELTRLRHQLEVERAHLRHEVSEARAFGEIVGESAALNDVLRQIERVAPTDATVLILGESGTGKELIASAIHDRSTRRQRALVRVNCASIPAELFESEFFGHVKGAFTGAVRDRAGRFELAHGGTLFLDEIAEIPSTLQGKLLRVLQQGQFERVGDDRTRTVDVRIIAATNRDLRRDVETGRFRQDLYYRFSVFPIEVPPLRERKSDIPALSEHFVRQSCLKLGGAHVQLHLDDIEALTAYEWPGNVRELQHVIERAVILGERGRLRLDLALPPNRGPSEAKEPGPRALFPMTGVVTDEEMRRRERQNILAALEQAHGKLYGRDGAAALLCIKATTLASRMKALGIRRPRSSTRDKPFPSGAC